MVLQAVTPLNWGCFINLSQQYEAEFGRLTGKLPDKEGRYRITLPDETHDAYLALGEDGSPWGFAVICTGIDSYDMAEFYVIPALRKHRIGIQMAWQLFDLYPGSWQVRQIEGADDACRFWLSVISTYTGGAYSDGTEADAEWGQVRIQRFDSGVLRQNPEPRQKIIL